jgi:WD40 repeat protein
MLRTSRQEPLDDYDFPLEPLRDFELDGNPAHYAQGHPKTWGDEDESIDFGEKMKGESDKTSSSYHSAISSDGKLLAISSNQERILIYDIGTKELRQVLEGAGRLAFRPSPSEEKDMASASGDGTEGTRQAPAYTLISSICDEAFRGGRVTNKLILWDLDQCGRTFDEEEPIDPSAFATKAIDAILPDLGTNHEWSKDFVAASTLHESFTKALVDVAADHRRRHNTVFESSTTGGFGSGTFSHDGKFLLYIWQYRSTQHGMRHPEKLPHTIVYDLEAGTEAHRLSGHTDAIMWTGYSPDDQYIASVSWDSTMRMYSASTGELEWTTPKSAGQSWSAAFSPNSKHIVWSSANGRVIQVHDVNDGALVSTVAEDFKRWCRCFSWNSDGEQIAFCGEKDAYVWRPFDGPNGKITQHFTIEEKDRWNISSISRVSWMDDGRLLSLQVSDGTKLVYDTHTNAKELFKRPPGSPRSWQEDGVYLLRGSDDGNGVYLCVDGDGKVRFWRRSVAQPPSPSQGLNKDNIPGPGSEGSATLPEQGAAHVAPAEEKPLVATREDWAEKGAALWTAE